MVYKVILFLTFAWYFDNIDAAKVNTFVNQDQGKFLIHAVYSS